MKSEKRAAAFAPEPGPRYKDAPSLIFPESTAHA
jgi:hypothetical protein